MPKRVWVLSHGETRVETFSSPQEAMQYARREFLVEWCWQPDGNGFCASRDAVDGKEAVYIRPV